MSFAILVYNIDSTLNKNGSIKKFVILQLAINDYSKYIDIVIPELGNIDLFLGHN